MKRMGEFKGITGAGRVEDHPVVLRGDVRVRVDLAQLAASFGPKALAARGSRIQLCNGAVVIEAFGISEIEQPPVIVYEPAPLISAAALDAATIIMHEQHGEKVCT